MHKTHINFVQWHVIFSAYLLQFLSLPTKMCIRPHVPSRKHQTTVSFTGHSGTVGALYENCFISPFWHLEFRGGSYSFRKLADLRLNTHHKMFRLLFHVADKYYQYTFTRASAHTPTTYHTKKIEEILK